MRLAAISSHPIQYQAPLFRELARRVELEVLYAHQPTQQDQSAAGFGIGFQWDSDLLGGYSSCFMKNVARNPGLDRFSGCDTPEIYQRLAKGKFDAVLVTGWHLKCFHQTVWAAKRLGIRVMVRGDSHLETPRSVIKRAVKAVTYPIVLRAFDVALYVGERSKQYWDHYGYPSERMVFSPHCVDNDWFAERATDAARARLRNTHGIGVDTPVALFAGKLVEFKRPNDLLTAAGDINRNGKNLTILVAGAGPLQGSMASLSKELGIRTVFLGFCNQSAMPEAYAASDMLVLPSDGRETWGLVANEALACGVPLVVSEACGCAPDLVADRAVGRTFPVGNISVLADALQSLIENPPPKTNIVARAERYSVAAAAGGIQRAVEEKTGYQRYVDE
jgi:glycosyltransferase involved in cell wall biosynthesis